MRQAPGAVRTEYSAETGTALSLRPFRTLARSEPVKADAVVVKGPREPLRGARRCHTATLSFDPCEESINIPILQMQKPGL